LTIKDIFHYFAFVATDCLMIVEIEPYTFRAADFLCPMSRGI